MAGQARSSRFRANRRDPVEVGWHLGSPSRSGRNQHLALRFARRWLPGNP